MENFLFFSSDSVKSDLEERLNFLFFLSFSSFLLPFFLEKGSKGETEREMKGNERKARSAWVIFSLYCSIDRSEGRENFPSDSIIVAIPFSTLSLSFLSFPFSLPFLLSSSFFFVSEKERRGRKRKKKREEEGRGRRREKRKEEIEREVQQQELEE